ncbi:MAG TPA: hypothetical protein VFL98_03965 [Candidatus Paceibacterota bacterium]|nr:hypothetical protein [Candidatus Paceibacterota bacterium]
MHIALILPIAAVLITVAWLFVIGDQRRSPAPRRHGLLSLMLQTIFFIAIVAACLIGSAMLAASGQALLPG